MREYKRAFERIVWNARVAVFYSVVFVFVSILCSLCLISTLLGFGYGWKYSICAHFSSAFIIAARLICGLKYKVEGLEKLPNTPSVLLSNHQSFWENIFVQVIIPRHSWVIKREMFNIPLFGWCLKLMDPIAVDRQDKNSVKDILKKGVEKLNLGLWLIIFPESTRLRPHQSSKLKPSAIKLAMIAKVPMVIMVHNAGLYWPKGVWIKKPGTIRVKIVEVMEPKQVADIDVRVVTQRVEEVMNYQKGLLLDK